MEMSLEYLNQTIKHLEARSFHVSLRKEDKKKDGEIVFSRHHFHCQESDKCDFNLECLKYPDGKEVFYLEILQIGSLSSFSFPLDSWKFHADRIEFKYYIEPESGLGLTFILKLSNTR